jgi:ABC-type branched-subunit amino acid transport system substrate-binding protein
MNTYSHDDDGELRILAGYDDQGRAAAEWAKSRGFSSVYILMDVNATKGAGIADLFRHAFPQSPLGSIDAADASTQWRDLVGRILFYGPDLLFYSGEEAPYSTAEGLFKLLRAKGYAGSIAMGEKDPEVSFLAIPCRVPEGTMLISPIGPPSKEFAEKYEPATGRHAGPHGWVGYQAMKAALDVLHRAESVKPEEWQTLIDRMPTVRRSCYLYCARNGKFEFVQDLK